MQRSALSVDRRILDQRGWSMIGWNTSGSSPSYNFLTIPGGGALAGTFTSGGTTTTWVPVIDASGSTLGLVNAATPQSGMATTYTYDPSGTATASGAANEWPFQYQGMEKEFTDPGPYYYTGSGQFYSPQFIRSLSEAGQTSTSQGACPSGDAMAGPSGGGPDVGGNAGIGTGAGGGAFLVTLGLIWGSDASTGGLVTFAAIVATVVDALVQGLLDLFGGSDNPPTPRKLLHGRHPLYPVILGVPEGEIPDEVSAGAPQFVGDPKPRPNARPLQRAEDAYQSPNSGQYYQSLHEIPPFAVCMGLVGGFNAESIISCVGQSINCGSTLFGNPEGPAGCVQALGPCAVTCAIVAGCYGVSRNIKQPAPPEGIQ
jgi:hypothetical protein